MVFFLFFCFFYSFVSYWAQGSENPENNTPEPPIRPQKATKKYRAERYPQNVHANFQKKSELISGFGMAGPAHCKMGGGRCSPRRGIQ